MSAPFSTIRLRTVNLPEAQAVAARFADLAYTQEPGYAVEAAARVGASARFLVAEDDGRPVGFAALRIKRIPLLGGGLAYLHGGPAIRTAAGPSGAEAWAACLGAIARQCSALQLSLRAAPALDSMTEAETDAVYRQLGFAPADGDGGRTIVLDLAPSLAELRAGLAGKWRTDLRRGEGGALRIVSSSAPADIAALQPMLAELAAHKGFALAQDAAFFARAAGHALPDAPAPIVAHLAYLGDELVGGHIGAFTGDTAVYLLGAANGAGREARAAFRLQWAVIEYAKARGLARYDLGGIDPAANPDVYRFKARMGGREVTRSGTWERRAGIVRPGIIALAERMRALRSGTSG